MRNKNFYFSPTSTNDYSALDSASSCGLKTKTLAVEVFTLVKELLSPDMFDPTTGRLKADATHALGTLGFIEFLDIEESIIDNPIDIDLGPKCTNISGFTQIKKLDLVITIGYSEVLYNNYENHDPNNSNAILGTVYNFTTLKVNGFEYMSVDADTSKYYNKKNYKLAFDLQTQPDIYAPVTIPLVGVVSQGTVTVSFSVPTPQ